MLARLDLDFRGLAVDGERDGDPAHDVTAATACLSAVCATARRHSFSSGKRATIRAASASVSFNRADASAITSGGPSSAASTARGTVPGTVSTQAVAFENSPTLR